MEIVKWIFLMLIWNVYAYTRMDQSNLLVMRANAIVNLLLMDMMLPNQQIIQFLNHFGDMIYKALDFGVSQENERELSEGIERIILHLCGECLSDLAGEEVLKKKHELNNKKAIQSYLKKLENLLEDFRTEYCQLNEIVSFNPEEIVAKYYNLCRETLKIADVINYKKQGFSKISQNQEQTAQKIPNHIDELLKQSQKETNGKANKKIDTLSNNDKDSDKLKDPVEIENEGGGDVLDNNALIADDTKVQPTSLHSSLEDMLNKLKGASSDNENNSGSLAPENNDFSELKAIGDDNQITDSRNVDEKPRLEGMKIIELTKICITMISAEFDAYNASTEFLNVLIDGRLCIICHGPTASNSEDRCIVCGFNSCPRHCSTVLIPEKPFLRDNMVHDFTEELPEGHQICPKSASINYSSYISNCLTANHYTYVVICEKCKDLSFGIKHEYLRESRS
ncbi:MAG: hypothetical protein MHMPM18_003160 [Marteilia pararefringens]